MREVVRSGVVRTSAVRAWWTARGQRAGAPVRDTPHILLLRPDHLGDVLLTTPALAALRAAVPHASLTILLGPWGAPALANSPHVDEIALLRFPGFTRDDARAHLQPYSLLVAAARRLRRERYDVAINLRPDFWWGAALVALAGIPLRIGFDLAPGRAALTDLLPVLQPDEHTVARSLRAVRYAARLLGADLARPEQATPSEAPLVFVPTFEDRRWADDWLAQSDIAPERSPILLHPGSGAEIKAWAPRRWAAVLAQLARDFDVPVLVTGAPHERQMVEAILRLLPSGLTALGLTGDLPLGRFAAVIERARLALGVDSGPLHLATAVGTPTVRLYGPTSPAVYGPWGPPGEHVALASSLACAPCGRLDYTRAEVAAHPCVRLITPGAVVAAAHAVLQHQQAAQPSAGAGGPGTALYSQAERA